MHNRALMIAIAVVALMTLTAGVAAAASMKAHKIEAVGGIGLVGLAPGGTVESKFHIDKKTGDLKSVKIRTIGETVGGLIGAVTACEPKGKHSGGACIQLGELLVGSTGSTVLSIHESSATLRVSGPIHEYHPFVPIPVISGNLKGSLKATMNIYGANGEILTGKGSLKIKSSELESSYGCLLNVTEDEELPAGHPDKYSPNFGTIEMCMAAPGPNPLVIGTLAEGPYSPVLVPVELHVVDTGKFDVKSDVSKLKGSLMVSVDTSPFGPTSGLISITKGKAEFAVEKEPKKPKKGDDD